MDLQEHGWMMFSSVLDIGAAAALRETLFRPDVAGTRCLLDEPRVLEAARIARVRLGQAGLLSDTAVAVQAIAFDKSPQANWKVTWHQDLMFPFARRVRGPGYDLATTKEEVDYARPPVAVLERMLAVRVHLDDCDSTNGPLRVSPGTHRSGVIPSAEIMTRMQQNGETTCLAGEGDALLMRPLLLHASSRATTPKHRRVLHLVYYDGPEIAEPWHRAI